jgi:hypothetical protein
VSMLDGHVQLVPISPGHDYGNTVEVTAGLSPVDQVVVNPSDSLVSGIRVEINTNTQTGQQNETEPRPRCSGCHSSNSASERLYGGS